MLVSIMKPNVLAFCVILHYCDKPICFAKYFTLAIKIKITPCWMTVPPIRLGTLLHAPAHQREVFQQTYSIGVFWKMNSLLGGTAIYNMKIVWLLKELFNIWPIYSQLYIFMKKGFLGICSAELAHRKQFGWNFYWVGKLIGCLQVSTILL